MYIQITEDTFDTLLENEFADAQKQYGDGKTKALWEDVKQLIIDTTFSRTPEDNDPSVLVDNYVFNSEIVSREEFEDPEYYIFNREDYDGFEEYAERNGILWNEDYVILNLGF